MKPILVHCHIYYSELWQELKKCIQNIQPYSFKLYVTLVEKHQDIIEDIMHTFPTAKIELVENRGYDVGPFVDIINKVDLDQYSYVVKIHTKRDIQQECFLNYFDVSGSKWRNYALDFISDTDKFRRCVQKFEKNDNLGMVSNYRLILDDKYQDDRKARTEVIKLLKKFGYKKISYGFVAGTIFMARAELLKPLQKLQLKLKDFDFPDSEHSSSLAHVIERFLGCSVLAEKKKISDVVTTKQYLIPIQKILLRLKVFTSEKEISNRVKLFVFRKKVSNRGILTIKICKIPVYRRKINE